MKTKLLLPALLLSISAFAQEPIHHFYDLVNPDSSLFEDVYYIVTSEIPLDQSAAGENVAWVFNGLNGVGMSATKVLPPTSEELTEYPGTTLVVRTTTTNSETNYFLEENEEGVYLNGAETSGMVLNYNTDNAFIGNFPLNYGYTNTDALAGTFTANGIDGTFTGTGTVSVDGYGTLALNVNLGAELEVTRLKTVQNLTLTYLGAEIGTVEQTMYSYYEMTGTNYTGGPTFRTITNHVVVPLFSIDQTSTVMETYSEAVLGIKNISLASKRLSVAPNPVNNILHFEGSAVVNTVTVTDVTGKIVLTANRANDINVSTLNPGIYFVSAQTEKGVAVTKIVKQ